MSTQVNRDVVIQRLDRVQELLAEMRGGTPVATDAGDGTARR